MAKKNIVCSEIPVKEDPVEAMASLRDFPGREPSWNILQAVKAWICVEDEEILQVL